MAEIAIPVIALGAMFLLEKDYEKEDCGIENFDNVSAPSQRQLKEAQAITHKPMAPPINYPKPTYAGLTENVKYYPAPNAATDRYFQQKVYEKKVEEGGDPTNAAVFQSLTGSDVQKCDIKHNNMVPFFGSKVTQRTTGFNGNESILDNLNGSGSTQITKRAQAPLFAPQKSMHWAHGSPNTSDFIQSRMNPSRNISNDKPWEEIRVGPGLNKGYTSEGSNGFNAGMEARKQWLPKTVDELRATTNPKVTFGLANHEGPAQGTTLRGIEGRVEKNRPDTFYMNSPDRWFTTTGQEKAQTVRSAQVLQPVNRPFTTRGYYGVSNGNQDGGSLAGKVEQNFRQSRKPILPAFEKYVGAAHNLSWRAGGDGEADDYGKDGYQILPNSRTTTRQANEFGSVNGWLRAITAPLMDMLRPSRKENVIGNMRPNGNASGTYGVNDGPVWNPADRLKTTIKEQTINKKHNGNPSGTYGVNDGAYMTNEHQPVENQRDTTSCPYTGDAGATPWSTAGPVYNAAYNANLNPNKEVLEAAAGAYENMGSMSLMNDMQNITVGKIGSTQPDKLMPSMPKQPGNIGTYGSITGRNTREYSQDCVRNEPNILSAFHKNPYTKSLTSVA